MYIESDIQSGWIGISYIKLQSRKNFSYWKRKTKDLEIQQGYTNYLKTYMKVCSYN